MGRRRTVGYRLRAQAAEHAARRLVRVAVYWSGGLGFAAGLLAGWVLL